MPVMLVGVERGSKCQSLREMSGAELGDATVVITLADIRGDGSVARRKGSRKDQVGFNMKTRSYSRGKRK